MLRRRSFTPRSGLTASTPATSLTFSCSYAPRRNAYKQLATLSDMPARTRSEGFALRWTADERDRIKARAAEAGMAVGPYLIASALGSVTTPTTESRLAELEQRMAQVEQSQRIGF